MFVFLRMNVPKRKTGLYMVRLVWKIVHHSNMISFIMKESVSTNVLLITMAIMGKENVI